MEINQNTPKWLTIVYKVLQFIVAVLGGIIGGTLM